MLTVDKINVFYGDAQALWDVGFKVDKGEIVTIVGSNGAGKTTTLKAISGLLHPNSGAINFLGSRIDNLLPHHIIDLGIAQIPEGRRLFPYMNVLENLEMGAYTRKSKREKERYLRMGLPAIPNPEGEEKSACWNTERRRAADAGYW